ncbi:pre-mRNA-splicing factor ISY1 homolog [Anopheles albimanus]|uniref:pre-mRNA-splicing factor ISY1 homolog n=1 Tax=Anopheles albimanus TaxID=7167 RepID=UPI0016419B0E|nr:pre-mRNA-splicing factor ISY1 homolog [Anopheles albimanus]
MATYQTQLWSLKMDESIHAYYKRTKELTQSMKTLARQQQLYVNHWEAINHFLEQECLAAFINGLNKQYFGYAQASKPTDLENAYAFFCKFQNAETAQKQTKYDKTQNFQNKYNNNNFKNAGKPAQNNQHNPQVYKPNKQSDRYKPVPMEIDPSLKTRQSKIFNHDAGQSTEPQNDESETDEEESEEEVNFQTAKLKSLPR